MKQLACENNGIFYSLGDNDDLAKVMSSYYAYYAAGVRNTGVRWLLYDDAATGEFCVSSTISICT